VRTDVTGPTGCIVLGVNDPGRADAGASGHSAGGRERSSLVGRDRELGQLLDGLDEARAGRATLFMLSGDAGIGKTRLADAFGEHNGEPGR
jgi:hypothetical protein